MRLELAGRIEEHHDQLAARDLGLHHEALAGFGDVAGLLQADLPIGALDQAVRGVVLQHAVADLDLVFGRRGELAHRGIGVGGVDQQGQVLARSTGCGSTARWARRSACPSCRAACALAFIDAHEGGMPPGIGAARARAPRGFRWTSAPGAAVRRAAACVPTFRRERLPFSVSTSSWRDGDELIHRKRGLADDQARHELGQRSDGQHGVVVLAEQHFARVLVDDQRHAGLQVQRIFVCVQAGQLAEGWPRRHSATRTTERRCTATTVLPPRLRIEATTLRPPLTTRSALTSPWRCAWMPPWRCCACCQRSAAVPSWPPAPSWLPVLQAAKTPWRRARRR